MERKLASLFDYQKFEGNRDLQNVIDAVHARVARRELTMDEMVLVNAAGDPSLAAQQKSLEKPQK